MSCFMRCYTKGAAETRALGKRLALKVLFSDFSRGGKGALLLALKGELGSGKTTFIQGFAQGLGIKERITSPTFVLLKKFPIPKQKITIGFKQFFHIDCYRLNDPKELISLGFREIIADPENIVAVEWAEKIKPLLPLVFITVKIKHQTKKNKNLREVLIFKS